MMESSIELNRIDDVYLRFEAYEESIESVEYLRCNKLELPNKDIFLPSLSLHYGFKYYTKSLLINGMGLQFINLSEDGATMLYREIFASVFKDSDLPLTIGLLEKVNINLVKCLENFYNKNTPATYETIYNDRQRIIKDRREKCLKDKEIDLVVKARIISYNGKKAVYILKNLHKLNN